MPYKAYQVLPYSWNGAFVFYTVLRCIPTSYYIRRTYEVWNYWACFVFFCRQFWGIWDHSYISVCLFLSPVLFLDRGSSSSDELQKQNGFNSAVRRRWSPVQASFQGEEASAGAYRRVPSCRQAANPDRSSLEISGGRSGSLQHAVVFHCSCPTSGPEGKENCRQVPNTVRTKRIYTGCAWVCAAILLYRYANMESWKPLYSIEQYAHFAFVMFFLCSWTGLQGTASGTHDMSQGPGTQGKKYRW